MCKKMENTHFKFHLPKRILLSIIFAGMWVPAIWSAYQLGSPVLYINLFNVTVILFAIWYVSIISINKDGMKFNLLWKVEWSNIKSVEKTRFFYIPHLIIKRRKGMQFWVPLYYIGETSIKEALLKSVPENNPLHEVACEL